MNLLIFKMLHQSDNQLRRKKHLNMLNQIPFQKAKPKRKPKHIKHMEVVVAPTDYSDDVAPIE